MKQEIPVGVVVAAIAVIVVIVIFVGYRALAPHRDAGPTPADMRREMAARQGAYGAPSGGGGGYPSSTGQPRGNSYPSAGGNPMSNGRPASGGYPMSGGR